MMNDLIHCNKLLDQANQKIDRLQEQIEQQAKEIERLQAVNNQWQREFKGAVDSYKSLEKENAALQEALQLLYDCQAAARTLEGWLATQQKELG